METLTQHLNTTLTSVVDSATTKNEVLRPTLLLTDMIMPHTRSTQFGPGTSWLARTLNALSGRPNAAKSSTPTAFETSLRALTRELELTAQLVTVSCAIANAIEKGTPVPNAQAQRYFPDRPKQFPAVLLGTQPLHLDRDTATSLSTLYESAALAIEMSLRHTTTSETKAQPWRTTARNAIEAVQQTQLLLVNSAMLCQLAAPEAMIENLRSVANGATTGVSSSGIVSAPGLREDRQFMRYLKSMPATLEVDIPGQSSIHAHIMLRDISRGGCGFDTTRRFARGTPVTLILHDQSRYEGNIAWAVGLSAGLEFISPINEYQAMFAGERRVKK
jgi:hypothetical protein